MSSSVLDHRDRTELATRIEKKNAFSTAVNMLENGMYELQDRVF